MVFGEKALLRMPMETMRTMARRIWATLNIRGQRGGRRRRDYTKPQTPCCTTCMRNKDTARSSRLRPRQPLLGVRQTLNRIRHNRLGHRMHRSKLRPITMNSRSMLCSHRLGSLRLMSRFSMLHSDMNIRISYWALCSSIDSADLTHSGQIDFDLLDHCLAWMFFYCTASLSTVFIHLHISQAFHPSYSSRYDYVIGPHHPFSLSVFYCHLHIACMFVFMESFSYHMLMLLRMSNNGRKARTPPPSS